MWGLQRGFVCMSYKKRCSWAKSDLAIEYHDNEWCQITRMDDQYLFELLILEGMQAGLSWEIILQRRKNYQLLFDEFDFYKIEKYTSEKLESLYVDNRIIKHKLKINSIVSNASQFIKVINEFGSFNQYLNQFTLEKKYDVEIHITENELSKLISKDLKKRGFKFVGSKIIFSYLQAIGIVNSHEEECFRRKR